MPELTSNVSDAEIQQAFLNTNFGHVKHRELLEASVLKRLLDYHCGFTITRIMTDLELITKNETVTTKGVVFLRHALHPLLLRSG